MDYNTLIPVLALILTVIGWGIAYLSEKRRDKANKKKEIQINYLINAWRLLESGSNRKDNTLHKNIETAIADIQLFGTKRQIELAQKFAKDMSDNRQADSLELLKELRNDLRKELKLEEVSDSFRFIRFNDIDDNHHKI